MVNSLRKVDFSHPTGHYTSVKHQVLLSPSLVPVFVGSAVRR